MNSFPFHKLFFWIKYTYPILVLVLISFSFRYALPGDGGGNSPADDLLAVRQANSLINGDWLGPWNYLTNAKPPGMAFYLAVVHFIPIEYKYVTHAFYLISAYFLITQIIKYLKVREHPRFALTFSFAIMALNPIIFQEQFNRVYRSTIVVIVMFVFFSVLLKFLTSIRENGTTAKSGSWRLSALIGFIFLVLYLLRQDSYWLIPMTLLLFCFQLFRTRRSFKQKARIAATTTVLFFVGFTLPALPVLYGNLNAYGYSSIEDFYTGNFAEVMKLWQNVEPGKDSRPFIPVTSIQRSAVYEISSTAKSLSPYLELGPNLGWKMNSCVSPIKICDESGAWFPWELRDAAVVNGGVKNSAEFQKLFGQISSDIRQACEAGSLMCGESGLGPGAKALTKNDITSLLSYFKMNLSYIFNLSTGGRISTPDKYASQEIIDEWRQVVNYEPASLSVPMYEMQYSSYLKFYEEAWSYVFWIFLLIIFLSLITLLSLPRKVNYIALTIYFIISGVIYTLGVSIFHLSLGFYVGGIYIFALQFCFILTSIVCALNLSENFKNFLAEKQKSNRSTLNGDNSSF